MDMQTTTNERRKQLDKKLILIRAANLEQDKFENWGSVRLEAARKLPVKWGKQARALNNLYAEYKALR